MSGEGGNQGREVLQQLLRPSLSRNTPTTLPVELVRSSSY